VFDLWVCKDVPLDLQLSRLLVNNAKIADLKQRGVGACAERWTMIMGGEGLTWMTFGGSQLAHLKVASLIRSMNLRCAFPFDQGKTPIVTLEGCGPPSVSLYMGRTQGTVTLQTIHRI
jgi:hypothetical protein